jgi:hypothetical protein
MILEFHDVCARYAFEGSFPSDTIPRSEGKTTERDHFHMKGNRITY